MYNNHSLIVYNILTNEYYGCCYIQNEKDEAENIEKIFNYVKAGWLNGMVICSIDGDWRDMKEKEICNKCCKFIKSNIKY